VEEVDAEKYNFLKYRRKDTPDFSKSIRTSPGNDLKIVIRSATNVPGSLTLPGPTGGAYNRNRICIREKVIKMFHGRFVHVRKT